MQMIYWICCSRCLRGKQNRQLCSAVSLGVDAGVDVDADAGVGVDIDVGINIDVNVDVDTSVDVAYDILQSVTTKEAEPTAL